MKQPLKPHNVGDLVTLGMYNEACVGMPKASKNKIQQALKISVLDLLDFFNAVGNSSEIQSSTQEVVK